MFYFDITVVITALVAGLILRKDLFIRNNLFILGTLYLFFATLWHGSNLY